MKLVGECVECLRYEICQTLDRAVHRSCRRRFSSATKRSFSRVHLHRVDRSTPTCSATSASRSDQEEVDRGFLWCAQLLRHVAKCCTASRTGSSPSGLDAEVLAPKVRGNPLGISVEVVPIDRRATLNQFGQACDERGVVLRVEVHEVLDLDAVAVINCVRGERPTSTPHSTPSRASSSIASDSRPSCLHGAVCLVAQIRAVDQRPAFDHHLPYRPIVSGLAPEVRLHPGGIVVRCEVRVDPVAVVPARLEPWTER